MKQTTGFHCRPHSISRKLIRLLFLLSLYVLVSFSRVGHGYPRGQKPHQPDVDYQPSEEDHV